MNVLVFDIETIPDIDGSRRLYDLHGLSDEDVARAVFHLRRQQANSETLRHHLHRIVAISALLVSGDNFKLWSLGDEDSSEQDLLQRFYAGLERYSPQLVSWNGSGFGLPVIQYRSLLYPLNARRYWESGRDDSEFHDNNYPSRFHQRHTDLMDVLSAYQPQAAISLQEIACLCGFPGNIGLHGKRVWETWLSGDIQTIRNDCETRVLNTYLVYLNWERNRGNLDQQQYIALCQRVRDELKNSSRAHLIQFETNWIDL